MKAYVHKFLNLNIHSSFIFMSTNKWMNKQIVLYPYHGILFSIKIEQSIDTWSNRNESPYNCDECKKPGKKRIHTVSFLVSNLLEYENKSSARADLLAAWVGTGEWGGQGGDTDHCGRKDDKDMRQPCTDGYLHYLDCCNSFISVCTCQYLSNCAF